MTEYFISPPTYIEKVPDSVSDEEAALANPLWAGVGSVKVAELGPGDSAVIIGAGKIGLGALLCAKVAGAAPVIVIDMIKSRLDKALEMGADVVINAKEVDVVSEVVKLTEAGPDAILICAREARVLNQSVDMVRRGGTILLTGFEALEEVNPVTWLLKNLRLVGTLCDAPFSLAMRLIANKQVNVKPLISAIMPLEDVQKAFDSMYSGENIVVLLKP
jgi:threonine dehydrogenase-like Zn-dependent dehydrogenase